MSLRQNDDFQMTLSEQTIGTDPFALFHEWFREAKSSEHSDPDAACLATAADGRPSARMVLVRTVDSRGFAFFTNENSRKGQQLNSNPFAALCYHWKSLGRQVRIEGRVEHTTTAESDDYFSSRHRGSRIGAWASLQSQPLESREDLLKRVAAIEKQYEGSDVIPRPAHWHGFRIVPTRIEFWQQGEFRLHDRFIFTRDDEHSAWRVERQHP